MKKLVKLTVIYQNLKASAVVTAEITDEDGWDRITVPEHIMIQMATDLGCPSGGDFTYIVSASLTASHDDLASLS